MFTSISTSLVIDLSSGHIGNRVSRNVDTIGSEPGGNLNGERLNHETTMKNIPEHQVMFPGSQYVCAGAPKAMDSDIYTDTCPT
jgi:hypothetical protein